MASSATRRVLVLLPAPLDGNTLGTGIRALELARVLRRSADVTLGVPGRSPDLVDEMPCVTFHPQDPSGLREALAQADVVLSTPRWPRIMRALRRSGARLIFDLYDPEPLEHVPGFPGLRPSLRRILYDYSIDRVADALRIGHQFLCASERQRDLWLGMMLADRLVDASRYDHDPSLRSLIDVVPFGIPATPPASPPGNGPRQRFPELRSDDEVVLWNGGLWPWLDAETPIRAVARLASRRPIRLVFMGRASFVPAERATAEATRLAERLGVLGTHVFFNDRLVPYEQRSDWLLDADCAVSAHDDHVETRFAFRTRLLDCLWSGLPIVCTQGDELADLVERRGLGRAVPPRDVVALANALEAVLDRGREPLAPSFAEVRPRFTWEAVSTPLVDWLSREPPPRAGGRARSPSEAARRACYLAGRRGLDLVGVRDWPRL